MHCSKAAPFKPLHAWLRLFEMSPALCAFSASARWAFDMSRAHASTIAPERISRFQHGSPRLLEVSGATIQTLAQMLWCKLDGSARFSGKVHHAIRSERSLVELDARLIVLQVA